MKKAIFSLALLIGSICATTASAQVYVSVRFGVPVFCPPPPPRVVVVKPVPVATKVVVVRPAPQPLYVLAKPRRKVVVYR
ncbi:hypothetical protein [Dyadobacter helix]|nr:hypothetical protein [Dyadobacter sp. CECT 9275]